MFRSYLKAAYRNLIRNKVFSLINIMGLSVGIAVSLLMLVHIKRELSYETDFPKHERIYRVASTQWAKMPPSLAEALYREMPEIEDIGRLYYINPQIIEYKDRQITADECYLADSSVINIFNLKFLKGNPEQVLVNPNTMVLTQRIAQKLFAEDEDPVGKTVKLNGYQDIMITGVMENLPTDTHLKIDFLASIVGSDVDTDESRTWSGVSIYALLQSPEAARRVSEKLRDFQYRFKEGIYTPAEIEREGDFFELHPITDIHLHSHREKEMSANSDIRYVYLFAALSCLIILIASINFINLFTTQALKRMKEVGVRKAIGARKGQLAGQFFGEAFFMVGIATAIALLLTFLFLPLYNQVAALQLTAGELFSFQNMLILIGLVLVTGLLSGAYPAWMVVRFGVVSSLKGKPIPTRGIISLRRGLIGFQFMISILILIGTLAISQQMRFVYEKDLGFDQNQLVAIKLYGSLWPQAVEHQETFLKELLRNSEVKSATVVSKLVGERFGYEAIKLKDSPDDAEIPTRIVRVGDGFLETMNIRLLQGRNFKRSADTSATFLINKAAAQQLPTENSIGRVATNLANDYDGQIIGVVEDFHFASLRDKVEPLVIEYRPTLYSANYLLVKIDSYNVQEGLTAIQDTVDRLAGGTPLVYHFLDDRLHHLYRSESDLYRIFQFFAVLSIVIACLGLFAMTAYAVEIRRKEIGIRKVLGASVQQLLFILSKEYMQLILIVSIIAIPLANYFITEWLQTFAYQASPGGWIFAVPGLIVLFVTLLSVSTQTLRAAMRNPVESLRDE